MLAAKLLCVLGVVVGLSAAFRAPNPRPGSYSLPNIGRYPAPSPTFPGRNQGLPPVYHGKFKRAAEDYVGAFGAESDAAFDEDPTQLEVVRLTRSADVEASEDFEQAAGELPELIRFRRERRSYAIVHPTYRPSSNGPRFIQPTYRPSRTGPRIMWA